MDRRIAYSRRFSPPSESHILRMFSLSLPPPILSAHSGSLSAALLSQYQASGFGFGPLVCSLRGIKTLLSRHKHSSDQPDTSNTVYSIKLVALVVCFTPR